MQKVVVKKPFFIFNPKSYLYGDELFELALVADEMAREYPDVSVFVTAPYADIANIKHHTRDVIISAQHMDGISPGRGMGAVLAESLYYAGARASFLNHAEHPLTFANLLASINRAQVLNMITIVCADSIQEAVAIASLKPDVILCEPTELIGTGQTSDDSYILSTNQAIKQVDESILVMQAAGISNAEDVYRTIQLGAHGTGCTSGIVKAANPAQMLRDMVRAANDAYREGVI